MANTIVAFIILSILGLALGKIVIEKRKGTKCVGCHLSGSCSSQKGAMNKSVAPNTATRIAIKELT